MKTYFLNFIMISIYMPLQASYIFSDSITTSRSTQSTSSFSSFSSTFSTFMAYFYTKDAQEILVEDSAPAKIKEKPQPKSQLQAKPRYESQQEISTGNLNKLMNCFGYAALKNRGKIAVEFPERPLHEEESVTQEQSSMQEPRAHFEIANRAAWNRACSSLPTNIEIMQKKLDILHPIEGLGFKTAFLQPPSRLTCLSSVSREFKTALSVVLDDFSRGNLFIPILWTTKGMPVSAFYFNVTQSVFQPYVQKLTLSPDDEVIFHGDIHGDIHSLLSSLNKLEAMGYLKKDSFELRSPQTYLVFLGDYVDKGYYGVEVMYTLLRLKIANPDHVILVRGNHEDFAQPSDAHHSFGLELASKFGSNIQEMRAMITRFYNFMPVALYLGYGNNYIQCCHGGIEHGYQPHDLLHGTAQFDLVGELERKKCLKHHDYRIGKMISQSKYDKKIWLNNSLNIDFTPASMQLPFPLGFVWFDFVKFGPSQWNPKRGLAANEEFTKAVLHYQNRKSEIKVKGIFRAHQHEGNNNSSNPVNLMSELVASKGVYKLWRPIEIGQNRSMKDGIVWTFNVSPDSSYGMFHNYTFNAFAVLKIATEYDDWKLQVFNTQKVERKKNAVIEFV